MKKIKRCIVRGFRELLHMRKIHSWLVAFVLSFMNFKACGTLTNNGAVYAILVIIGQGFLLYLFGHINIIIEEKTHEKDVEWRKKSKEILEPIRNHLPKNIEKDDHVAVNYIVAALDNAQNANNVPKLFNPQREREHRD